MEHGMVGQLAEALIARSETCLLTSIDDEGFPAVRAMLAPRERLGMTHFIFSTNTSSRHVGDYLERDRAGLYFYDPGLFQGLLLKGKMEVSRNNDLRNRVWRDGDEVYYRLGVDDPDYSVICFTATMGRWYADFMTRDLIPGQEF